MKVRGVVVVVDLCLYWGTRKGGPADKGGGGMMGNALRLTLCEWDGVMKAVDGSAWMSGVGSILRDVPFSLSHTVGGTQT